MADVVYFSSRVLAEEGWSHCPKCTSSATRTLPDGPDFECRDCGHMWLEPYNHYDHEPESNPDR